MLCAVSAIYLAAVIDVGAVVGEMMTILETLAVGAVMKTRTEIAATDVVVVAAGAVAANKNPSVNCRGIFAKEKRLPEGRRRKFS